MDARSIVIVGLGGGGARVVSLLARTETADTGDRPVLAVVDTDSDLLDRCHADTKLQIGEGRADGRGAGGDPRVGRLCAQDDVHMVRGLFTNANMAIVVTGLGGGVGTGACPIVLDAARETGAMTVCVATLPFAFEGEVRRTQAEQAVEAVRDAGDLLILIPNERMAAAETGQIDAAFDAAARRVVDGMAALWRLLTRPGYISLDMGNLQHVAAASGGVCTMSYGEGKGRNRAAAAAEQALTSSMLAEGSILKRAGAVAVSIVAGADLTLVEVGQIMDAVKGAVPGETDLSMGTVLESDGPRRIGVAIFAAEERFATPVKPLPETGEAQQPEARRRGGRLTRKERDRQRQHKLSLEASGLGRFKGVHPTVLNGEDLDIPTYIRRGIRIEK